jgi:hypothetical protein
VLKDIGTITSIVAVVVFLLGYLQRKRITILLFNITSRVLYILSYVFLGALSGALLDVMGTAIAALAGKKNSGFVKKHLKAMIIGSSVATVIAGIVTWVLFEPDKWYAFMPIVGILLQAGAFWLDDEKWIRRLSLAGCPFWFTYNLLTPGSYAFIGDALSAVSLLISMYRYDFKKNSNK